MLPPLITICGATGVGKSKLAIELALHLKHKLCQNAKIINADSMQVYKGMDIITNKVPMHERAGIEHLLMDFRPPGEQYIVGEWVQDAVAAIEETHSHHEIPIVVGGTSYWIQHLLFPNRLTAPDARTLSEHAPGAVTFSESLAQSIALLPPDLLELFNTLPEEAPSVTEDTFAYSLYGLLNALDPVMATRWHWRDTRKVLRSVHIIKQTGKRPSEIMTEQATEVSRPRYRTLCFWLYAEPAVLNQRLDTRVDDMIEQGLLDEIRILRSLADSEALVSPANGAKENDYTLGIYQSIGYREFHTYLSSPERTQQAFSEASNAMKSSTRRYAKRQIQWIRNQLLPAVHSASASSDSHDGPTVSVYLINATELGDSWNTQVRDLAIRITEDFLAKRELPDPLSLSPTAKKMLTIPAKSTDPMLRLSARRRVTCPVCTTDPEKPCMIEEGDEWDAHVRTKTHRHLATRDERLAAQKARQEEVRAARAKLRGEII